MQKLKDYLAVSSVAIIVLGIVKLVLYYAVFSIPISYFLSLQEIAVIISDELVGIIILLLIYSFIVIKITFARKETKTPTQSANRIANRIKLIKSLRNYCYFLLILAIICYFLKKEYFFLLLGLLVFFSILVCEWYHFELSKSKESKDVNRFMAIVAISMVTLSLLLKLVFDVRSVGNGKYVGTKVFINDSTYYLSTKNSFFIGKTSEYVFIYNKARKETTILPTSEVKKIVLKTN